MKAIERRARSEASGETPAYPRDALINELFFAVAESAPSSIALAWEGKTYTYAELSAAAIRLSHRLRGLGAGPGTVVGTCQMRTPQAICALLAILETGAAYLPIDPGWPSPWLRQTVLDAEPCCIVSDADPGLDGATIVPAEFDAAGGAARLPPSGATATDPAYVMYTSGSTGTPKGICIPHRGVVRLVKGTDYARFGPDRVFLQLSSLAFDASTFEIWGALLHGAKLVIQAQRVPTFEALGELIASQRVSTAFMTSALFNQMMEHHPGGFAGMDELLVGGGMASPVHFRRFLRLHRGTALINAYGPTETTTFAVTHRFRSDDDLPETAVPIGHSIAHSSAYVLREDGSACGQGEAGELYLGGDGLALGYLRRPDLTGRAFLEADRSPIRGERLYRTGDRCMLDPLGRIVCLGRLDRQVKIRGHRIELEELERCIGAHPGVAEAAAKSWGAREDDKQLAAYVSIRADALAPDVHLDAKIVSERIRQWLATYESIIYRALDTASEAAADPLFNFTGWKSSYDGSYLAREEMAEQVEQTVQRMLEGAPAAVLEIGCGSGMLLFKVAPAVSRYVATDFSPAAIRFVQHHLRGLSFESKVELRCEEAHAIEPAGMFDLVVLNSVVQHFPGQDYLRGILRRVLPHVADGGRIYLGDLRALSLAGPFHRSLAYVKGCSAGESLEEAALRGLAEEEELLLDPAWFQSLAPEGVTAIRPLLKRGRHHNEITRYRYDLILEVGRHPVQSAFDVAEWSEADFTIDSLASRIGQLVRPLRLRGVPNARLLGAPGAAAGPGRIESHRWHDPEHFWRLAESHPVRVEIRPAEASPGTAFDVDIIPAGAPPLPPAALRGEPGAAAANDPLVPLRKQYFMRALRETISRQLPGYFMPAALVALEQLPMTSHGKVDHGRLPLPALAPAASAAAHGRELTENEAKLAALWRLVLGIESPGPEDHFFELGGDSLKAIELANAARPLFAVALTPAVVFDRPRLKAMAEWLGGAMPGQSAANSRERGLRRRAARGRART